MNHPLLTIRLALKRLYEQEMSAVMTRYQLTRMELDVLLFLANNPLHNTAAEIVQLRALTKSHVSRAVEHLTDEGLLHQQRDGQNRRRIHLTLTERAAPVVAAGQASQQRFVDALTSGLTQEDNDALCRIMETVTRNAMNAVFPESTEK